MKRRFYLLVLLHALFLSFATNSQAQENGNLQIHFMNVGRGDGAMLISPRGEVVLFDNGVRTLCDLPVSNLQQLGVDRVDYHVTSHYHDDHKGPGHLSSGPSPFLAAPTTLSATTAAGAMPEAAATPAPKYSRSRRAKVYHHSSCLYVHNISPDNLETGNAAPPDRSLHKGCPK